MRLSFNEKEIAAIIMYSARRFVYASAYRLIVNALMHTNPALEWHDQLVWRVIA